MDRKKMIRMCSLCLVAAFAALLCVVLLKYTDNRFSDLRNVKVAAEEGLTVEDVRPKTVPGAMYLASAVRVDEPDTVFLGYWLGMGPEEFRRESGRNLTLGKLEILGGRETYMFRISEAGRDYVVPMVIVPEFFEDRLLRLSLSYVHLNSSKKPMALPFERSLEMIDGILRGKYEDDGRVRYTSKGRHEDSVSYYRGNTFIGIKSSVEEGGKVCSIVFLDCFERERKAQAELAEKEAEKENARLEVERKRMDTAGDF